MKKINEGNDALRFDLGKTIGDLSIKSSLNENLTVICDAIKQRYPDISRISVGIFDEKTETLKAFLSTKGAEEPLAHLEAPMAALEDLKGLMDGNHERRVRHLEEESNSYTAAELLKKGFKSSYIAPIFEREEFIGVIALSSTRTNRFDYRHLRVQIDVIIKLISILVVSEIYAIKGLKGTAKTLKEVAALRDNETGEHLERMSRYSRLIALDLAEHFGFDDEYIEEIFQCAPLHDIGKIAIPDRVLLKPDRLTISEFDEMKEHTTVGRDIIIKALKNLHMDEKSFSQILINIVYGHHENWDGSGYPQGIKGEEIPPESRIIRVADVYDALTCKRPYKEAWTHQNTLDYLAENSGVLFDPECVRAAHRLGDKFLKVAAQFQESDL